MRVMLTGMHGHHRPDPLATQIAFLVAVGCISSGVVLMLDFTRMLLGYVGLGLAFVGLMAAVLWFFLLMEFHKGKFCNRTPPDERKESNDLTPI
jgi:hypothetical protein